MLTNTFLHIPGVGKKTERKLWKNKVHDWNSFLEKKEDIELSKSKQERITEKVEKSIRSHEKKNYDYLISNFPGKIHWRTYKELKENGKCCFLDIETTGLDKQRHEVTVIGLYNGEDSKFFINGRNLKDFRSEIEKYDLIVSFNGKCFDVPFLERNLKGLNLKNDMFHIDLRYEMKKIGYSGGLKSIEKDLNVSRSDETQGVDGYEAVILWKKYKKGDKSALKKLLHYNREDIENLENLMDFAYGKLRKNRFEVHA